jgi:ABC-type bacteriocin/lantibiotic exporter with double-glycine peptidase domain|tara:strand:- start:317 stop:2062 length:1746 start_codon:yes stop_codon:yes gene_type:complete
MFSFRIAWSILNHAQKKNLIYIFILMLVSMNLEALSIGIMIPLISILLKDEVDSSLFSHFFTFLPAEGGNLIYVGLSVTLIIFLIKNIFLIFNHWYQSKFLEKIYVELSDKLFKHYLKRDYIFFLRTNTAQLITNIRGEIPSFIEYLNRMITFLGEIIIFFGIVILLFYVDFLGTIIILVISIVCTILIYTLTKGKIDIYGKERITVDAQLNKHLMQGIASAKDIKILDREEDLIHQFYRNLLKLSKISLFIKFINGLPKFLFEILVVCAFLILVLSMINTNRDTISIIQYLGVFGIASFRIIPGTTRIFTSYQQIRFRQFSIKLLSKEFNQKDNFYLQKKSEPKDLNMSMKFQKEINLKNLYFSYPTRREFSLSGISMTLKKGDFVGIIGETGSGKSTLINLFTGLLKPSEGKIEVDGLNIFSNLSEWHKKIGYVPQSIYLMDDTIKKNIAFGLREDDIDDNSIKQAVDEASLSEFLKSLPNGLDTIVGEKGIRISGGQQQRIGIARALYRDPEVLILDEATSSLDQVTEKKIMDSIQFLKRKKTLIIVTHRLSTVDKCDKIFFVNEGKIVKQGLPKEIL